MPGYAKVRQPGQVKMSPTFLMVLVGGLIVGIGGLAALIWFLSTYAIEKSDAFAMASAYAVQAPDVLARTGPVASTVLGPGESRCMTQTAYPPTGDAAFTVLATGDRGHAKLDVRAHRDADGWHLTETRVRPSDDAPFSLASTCHVETSDE